MCYGKCYKQKYINKEVHKQKKLFEWRAEEIRSGQDKMNSSLCYLFVGTGIPKT